MAVSNSKVSESMLRVKRELRGLGEEYAKLSEQVGEAEQRLQDVEGGLLF